jgi:NADPH:quinone reductase-like Zn-dependent oxidoreductase
LSDFEVCDASEARFLPNQFYQQKLVMQFSKMKAAVYTRYGPAEVLKIKNIPRPEPSEHEILIKIHATPVNIADVRLRKADPFAVRLAFGLFRPKKPVLGGVFSGEVVQVGAKVKKFQIGDQVFGSTAIAMGAHAEFICLPESGPIAIKPEKISHLEAAAIPFGAMSALYFLRKANIQPGQNVLIYGASGAVGTAAVQIARHFGAQVTGICSTSNLELVKSLGAQMVLDYTKDDLEKYAGQFDVVYETVNKTPISFCQKMLKKQGTMILGAALLTKMLQGAWVAATSATKLKIGVGAETAELAEYLKKMIENGEIKPVIDRVYPLEGIQEAHQYVELGHKKGNVLISMA